MLIYLFNFIQCIWCPFSMLRFTDSWSLSLLLLFIIVIRYYYFYYYYYHYYYYYYYCYFYYYYYHHHHYYHYYYVIMFKFDSQVDLNFLEFLTWELLPTSCQRSQVNLSTLHYNDKTFFKIRAVDTKAVCWTTFNLVVKPSFWMCLSKSLETTPRAPITMGITPYFQITKSQILIF